MQGELLPPVHLSRQRRRLRKGAETNPERIYAAAWARLNRPSGSYPRGVLELLLRTDQDLASGRVAVISQRDAEVAAAMIQWLGTNVGLSLILAAERKIDEDRKGRMASRDANDRPSLFEARQEPHRTRDIVLED